MKNKSGVATPAKSLQSTHCKKMCTKNVSGWLHWQNSTNLPPLLQYWLATTMSNEKRVKRQKSESRSKILSTYPFINKSGEIWFIFSSLLLCYRVLYKNYLHEWRSVLLCIASRGVRWHFLGPSSVGSRWEPNLWIRGALQLQAREEGLTTASLQLLSCPCPLQI